MSFLRILRRFFKALIAILSDSIATEARLAVCSKKKGMAEIRLIPGGASKRVRLEGAREGAPAEFLDTPEFTVDSPDIVIEPIEGSDDVRISASAGADTLAVLTGSATGVDAEGNPTTLSDTMDIDASAEEVIATEAHLVEVVEGEVE